MGVRYFLGQWPLAVSRLFFYSFEVRIACTTIVPLPTQESAIFCSGLNFPLRIRTIRPYFQTNTVNMHAAAVAHYHGYFLLRNTTQLQMLLHNQSINVSFFTASYILEKLQPPTNPPRPHLKTQKLSTADVQSQQICVSLAWSTQSCLSSCDGGPVILRIFLKAQHVSQYTATNITNRTASIFTGCCFKHPFISGTFFIQLQRTANSKSTTTAT